MNFKNKYFVITLRILFGLFLVFSGVAGFLFRNSTEGIPAPMLAATQSLWDMGLFQMIKVTEILAGLMLATGFFPALALLFVAPISVGIVVFNAFLAPAYILSGIIMCVVTAYFGYIYWDHYKAIFKN